MTLGGRRTNTKTWKGLEERYLIMLGERDSV